MAIMTVTLKATLKKGVFYWVSEVNAVSEDEAIVAAENLFFAELDKSSDWAFTDFEVVAK
ncbi:MAG: hypothetical protein ACKVIX_06425 [Sphingomonadales bacterium]